MGVTPWKLSAPGPTPGDWTPRVITRAVRNVWAHGKFQIPPSIPTSKAWETNVNSGIRCQLLNFALAGEDSYWLFVFKKYLCSEKVCFHLSDHTWLAPFQHISKARTQKMRHEKQLWVPTPGLADSNHTMHPAESGKQHLGLPQGIWPLIPKSSHKSKPLPLQP